MDSIPRADESGVTVDQTYRAGVVALLGPPNAGKSTLLNRLLGEKLAIVTAKPQTTRSKILGVLSRPKAQLLLLDTPGKHESSKRLNLALNDVVQEASQDCDVAVLVVDALRGWEPAHDQLLTGLRKRGIGVVAALNKIDRLAASDSAGLAEAEEARLPIFALSARTGAGVEALLKAVEAQLPESPPLYPEDHLTDRPVRWLCGEIVREVAFEVLEQELPYSIAVDVVQYRDHPRGGVAIHANLLVARESQKRIVVGAGGRTIGTIGRRARQRIEGFLGDSAHLNLFVKVDPRWLENARRIEALGYR